MRLVGLRAVSVLMVALLLLSPLGAFAEGPIEPPHVPVTKLKFTKTSGSLNMHQTFDLSSLLKISPAGATNKAVSWLSADPAIISVSDAGVVKALSSGTARITATSVENPALFASITIKGKVVRVKSIALDRSKTPMNAGETFTVRATVSPSDASYPEVTWASDNTAVATVDANGVVTGVAPGRAAIIASTDLGRATKKMYAYVRGGAMKVIKISSVGDVVLGGDKKTVKKADKPIGDGLTSWLRFQKFFNNFGPAYFTDGVRSVLSNDDLSIANLEGTITPATKPVKNTFAFKGKPEYLKVLTQGSVEVVTLANNHTWDYLKEGLADTKKNLKKYGITAINNGSGGTVYRTINGVRIGMCGFNIPVSRGTVSRAITYLKKTKKCQIVIAQFHWAHSKEWTNKIYNEERSLAHYAVSKGADLVVGHHKHQVSGIERYKDKMIAYDVGNFIAMVRNEIDGKILDKGAMIYQQKFNVFEDGFVEVLDPNIVPIMISDSQGVLTGNPHVESGAEADRILGIVRANSPATGVGLVKYDPNY